MKFMLPLCGDGNMTKLVTDHRAGCERLPPIAVRTDAQAANLVVGGLLVIIGGDAHRERIEIIGGGDVRVKFLA